MRAGPYTRLAMILGLVVFALMLVLAISGIAAFYAPVVTVVVLVVLIGGGNYLTDAFNLPTHGGKAARPPAAAAEPDQAHPAGDAAS